MVQAKKLISNSSHFVTCAPLPVAASPITKDSLVLERFESPLVYSLGRTPYGQKNRTQKDA